MLEELDGDVLVDGIVAGQLERDAEHVQAEHRHPARAVGLLEPATAGQRLGAVKRAQVVEAEHAAFKQVAAFGVLAVDPPGEVQQQLVEGALEEGAVGVAADAAGDFVDAPDGPGVHGRVDVVEVPLVGGELPLGCMYHSRSSSTSCCLASSGSTGAMATQWNARSQAAYQGYSHLSGISRMSLLCRWRQRWLRPWRRAGGGGGNPGSPSSQTRTT